MMIILLGFGKSKGPKKPKKPKKELSREDQVWFRLRQPAWGVLIFAALPIIIIGMDVVTSYPEKLTWTQLFLKIGTWQSLLAGFFALIAAVFTARAVVMQVASAEKAEHDRLEAAAVQENLQTTRALMAARSVMPLTLSVLMEYTNAVAEASITVLDRTPGSRVRLKADKMPPLPPAPGEIISSLQAFILAAPVEMGPYVADLLSDLQLLSANANSTWNRTIATDSGQIVMKSNYEALIGRSAVLHARVSGLYPFARRETDIVPDKPLKADLDTALKLWLVAPAAYPRYVEAADAYFKKATSPAA